MKEKRIKVVLTNHTFELRNVQVAEFMSEETTAFNTDIYIDGRLCGYCKNSGKGEGNYPMMIQSEDNDLLAEIEKECMTHTCNYAAHGKVYTFTYNLDFLIGMMVEAAWFDNKKIFKF